MLAVCWKSPFPVQFPACYRMATSMTFSLLLPIPSRLFCAFCSPDFLLSVRPHFDSVVPAPPVQACLLPCQAALAPGFAGSPCFVTSLLVVIPGSWLPECATKTILSRRCGAPTAALKIKYGDSAYPLRSKSSQTVFPAIQDSGARSPSTQVGLISEITEHFRP